MTHISLSRIPMPDKEENRSESFELTITYHLMKDCYDKEISRLGRKKAHEQMEATWRKIEERLQRQKSNQNPMHITKELVKENNYDRLLHTQCYSAIFYKIYVLDDLNFTKSR